jgi:hypothetical protein
MFRTQFGESRLRPFVAAVAVVQVTGINKGTYTHMYQSAPWYVSNRQVHEDLGVPLFADHNRALTASFDSKLADVGNPLVQQIGRYLR